MTLGYMEDNINMYHKEIGWESMVWIHPDQERDQ